MHRLFKEVFGRNIYESIKSIRLQKGLESAADQSLLHYNRSGQYVRI